MPPEAPILNIIHLPHRKDRYEHLMGQLKSQRIEKYRIWDGIINEDNVYTGISQSFKRIVRDAKESELEMVMICEDDILFTDKDSMKYFLENTPAYFDMYIASFYSGLKTYDHRILDFRGMTLVIVHQKFYDTFISLPEEKSIDHALVNKGEYFVCPLWPAIQIPGYSDQKKEYVDYTSITPEHKLFRGH